MEPQSNDLKAIRILFFALLAGQVLFAVIITVLVETGILSAGDNKLTPIMQVATMVITAATVPPSFFLFRKRLSVIDPDDELGKKLEKYRAALILKMALSEMPTLFATIAYFITHNRFFLWMIIILISNFIFIYPSKDKIINHLQLNSSEQTSLGMD